MIDLVCTGELAMKAGTGQTSFRTKIELFSFSFCKMPYIFYGLRNEVNNVKRKVKFYKVTQRNFIKG